MFSFKFLPNGEEDLQGMWVRVTDELRIKVSEESSTSLQSFIVEEGAEAFPCEVSSIPIYKNIHRVSTNLWRCEFLVVTLGSCATDYEEGIIRINKDDQMEITCPGFEKRIYSRMKPRYE
jgi:hypothetical protein